MRKRITCALLVLLLLALAGGTALADSSYPSVTCYPVNVPYGNYWIELPREWQAMKAYEGNPNTVIMTDDGQYVIIAHQPKDMDESMREAYGDLWEEGRLIMDGATPMYSKPLHTRTLCDVPATLVDMVGQDYEMVWLDDMGDLYFIMYPVGDEEYTGLINDLVVSFRIINPKTPPVCNEADYTSRELADGTVEITGYTGTSERLRVPDTIGGKPVTRLGDRAFYEQAVRYVELPDSIREIGEYVFAGNLRLGEVVLPQGLQALPIGTFESCARLDTISIPDSVRSIGSYCFWANYYLERLRLPASLMELGDFNFCLESWFEGFELDESCPGFKVEDGGAVLLSKDGKRLVRYAPWQEREAYAVPDGVEVIAPMSFGYASNLTEITLPDGLLEIYGDAFMAVSKLERLVIPDSVEKLGTVDNGAYTTLEGEAVAMDSTNIALNSVVIVGKPGGVAEAYAKKFGHPFEAME